MTLGRCPLSIFCSRGTPPGGESDLDCLVCAIFARQRVQRTCVALGVRVHERGTPAAIGVPYERGTPAAIGVPYERGTPVAVVDRVCALRRARVPLIESPRRFHPPLLLITSSYIANCSGACRAKGSSPGPGPVLVLSRCSPGKRLPNLNPKRSLLSLLAVADAARGYG